MSIFEFTLKFNTYYLLKYVLYNRHIFNKTIILLCYQSQLFSTYKS